MLVSLRLSSRRRCTCSYLVLICRFEYNHIRKSDSEALKHGRIGIGALHHVARSPQHIV